MIYADDHLRYASEKFGSAVHDMARSDKPLRQRLHDAYMCFHPVGLFELPERLQAQFAAIRTRLNAIDGVADEGSLVRTLLTVSDQECRRLARMIVDLECEIRSELEHRERRARYQAEDRLRALLLGPEEELTIEQRFSGAFEAFESERSG